MFGDAAGDVRLSYGFAFVNDSQVDPRTRANEVYAILMTDIYGPVLDGLRLCQTRRESWLKNGRTSSGNAATSSTSRGRLSLSS